MYSHLLLLANMKQSLSLQYNKAVNSSTTYIVMMQSQHPHNIYILQSDIVGYQFHVYHTTTDNIRYITWLSIVRCVAKHFQLHWQILKLCYNKEIQGEFVLPGMVSGLGGLRGSSQ